MVYIFINVSGFFLNVPRCMLVEPFSVPLKTIMLAVMHMNLFSRDECEARGGKEQWSCAAAAAADLAIVRARTCS